MAVQSLPRRQSIHPGSNEAPAGSLPRVRPKDKSKVESLMKLRYSTRGVPVLPSIDEPFPAELSAKSKAITTGPSDKVYNSWSCLTCKKSRSKFDPSPLASRGFDPEQYIATSLSGAKDEDIQTFYENLRDLRSSTSTDLRLNVFNNYASFVSLSHEISSLTSDLSSLSSLLLQFSNLVTYLSTSVQKEDEVNVPSGFQHERRGAQHHRNSVADLAQIHASHLQELWHLVEGSQKFLPAHPGRHVIKESLNWTELNTATWKPTKIVHLILLNDHLLVAAKKRGKASTHSRRSVVDHCWNLADIEVREILEDRDGRHASGGALQVTLGREVLVYTPPEGYESERTSFLQAFKMANIDLYNKRKQTEATSMKCIHLFLYRSLIPISRTTISPGRIIKWSC
jgi:exocyst complex component 8